MCALGPWTNGGDSVDAIHELRSSDSQPMRQLHDVEQTHVSLATLHATHVISVQVRQLR